MKAKSNIVNGIKGKMTGSAKGKSTTVKGKGRNPDVIENPLAKMKLTDSLEDDCATEAGIIMESLLTEDELQKQKLREADKRIQAEADLTNDTEYFCCIMFESRDQKEAFLKGMGWALFGDKYINGLHLARKQGIDLPAVDLPADRGNKRSMFRDLVGHDPDAER